MKNGKKSDIFANRINVVEGRRKYAHYRSKIAAFLPLCLTKHEKDSRKSTPFFGKSRFANTGTPRIYYEVISLKNDAMRATRNSLSYQKHENNGPILLDARSCEERAPVEGTARNICSQRNAQTVHRCKEVIPVEGTARIIKSKCGAELRLMLLISYTSSCLGFVHWLMQMLERSCVMCPFSIKAGTLRVSMWKVEVRYAGK